jgi:hypothetical protein
VRLRVYHRHVLPPGPDVGTIWRAVDERTTDYIVQSYAHANEIAQEVWRQRQLIPDCVGVNWSLWEGET